MAMMINTRRRFIHPLLIGMLLLVTFSKSVSIATEEDPVEAKISNEAAKQTIAIIPIKDEINDVTFRSEDKYSIGEKICFKGLHKFI